MGEFNVIALRFAFLILLWLFVFAVVVALRRDISLGQSLPQTTARKVMQVPNRVVEKGRPSAPAAAARTLEVVAGVQRGKKISLSGSPIVLGRAQDSSFVLKDDYASGRHARLFPQGSRWFIEDLGSTNGVSVSGQLLTRATPVDVNTPIQIGKTVLELKP